LLTLVHLGYASQEGRHFTLSPKVLILSRSQLGGNPILGAVQSILETIAGKTRESASAAVLNSSEIILVARAQSPRPFSANVSIGTCLPAFRTAMGKVLLSELPEQIVRKLPYDVERDFQPIAQVMTGHLLLAVAPSRPIHSVAELVEHAKKNPGKLSNASSGSGSPGHVSGELFKFMSGTEIVHLPYKVGTAAITDLIAGRVDLMFESLTSIAPYTP
jgi:hypothetical protein